jgi:HrpA-like RNA helicase
MHTLCSQHGGLCSFLLYALFSPLCTTLRPFQVQRRRPQLRLVLSSATLQARALADFFQPPPQQVRQALPPGAPVRAAALVSVEGQLHPVRVHYLEEPCRDYLQQAVATALEIHATQRPGDVLVFLTGQVRETQEWRWFRRTLRRCITRTCFPCQPAPRHLKR